MTFLSSLFRSSLDTFQLSTCPFPVFHQQLGLQFPVLPCDPVTTSSSDGDREGGKGTGVHPSLLRPQLHGPVRRSSSSELQAPAQQPPLPAWGVGWERVDRDFKITGLSPFLLTHRSPLSLTKRRRLFLVPFNALKKCLSLESSWVKTDEREKQNKTKN